MTVTLETEFARVWCDENSPYIFTIVNRMPERREQIVWHEKQMELIRQLKKKFKEVYCIADFTECCMVPVPAAQEYADRFLPDQLKAGLWMINFIKPKNLMAQVNLEDALRSADPAKVFFFNSFEVALQAINHRRSQNLSEKLKKEKSFLFPFLLNF